MISNAGKSEYVERLAIFGSAEATVRRHRLEGGSLTSIFGSIELDLREADLASEGGTLGAVVVFGSVRLRVPEDWDVQVGGVQLFGSIEDKRPRGHAQRAGPTLRLQANVFLGSVEITS
jgi:predicted membrane protein